MYPGNYLVDKDKFKRPTSISLISIYYWLQALSLFGSGIVSFLTIINGGTNNNPERTSASIVYFVVALSYGIASTMAGDYGE